MSDEQLQVITGIPGPAGSPGVPGPPGTPGGPPGPQGEPGGVYVAASPPDVAADATLPLWVDISEDGEPTVVPSTGVTTEFIADQAVTAAKIANDTITAAQIAANAVGSSELADNAVDTNAIADSAVTSAKIADGTIATGDLADGAVTPAKLATTGRFTFPTGAANGYGFASGAVHLSGTGAPEGQVAAPVGSTYMQTDSVVDKRGVLTWLKVSGTSTTGWEPDANFDTGSLDVLHLKHASAAVTLTVSRMKLRRKGSLITFDVSWIDAQTNPHRQPLMVIPSGFRPAAGGYFAVPYDASTSVIRNVHVGVSLIEYGGPTQASTFHATLTWDTYDPPPAAKP